MPLRQYPSPLTLAVLLVLASFILFFGIHWYPLANGQEAQAAEIAREMFSIGDYLVPHFNFIPHLESPPLFYWLTSLSFFVGGINDVAARFGSSLSMLLLCALLLFSASRANQCERGVWSVVIALSSFGVVWIARSAVPDVMFALSVSAAVYAFYFWVAHATKRDALLCWAATGVSVLLKGWLALGLILPILLLYYFFAQSKVHRLNVFFHWQGLALALIIALPWYGVLLWQQPTLFATLLNHEQLIQMLGITAGGITPTYGFFAYLLPLLVLLFPWSLLLPSLVIKFIKMRCSVDDFTRLHLVWFLTLWLFYTLSPIKSIYFTPVLTVPLACLIAHYVQLVFAAGRGLIFRYLFYALATFALLVAVGFAVLIYRHDALFTLSERAAVLAASTMLTFVVFGFVVLIYYRDKPHAAFYLNACLIFPMLFVGIVIANQMKNHYSEQHLALLIDKHFYGQPLYLYQPIKNFSSLIYYTTGHANVIEPRASASTHVPTSFAVRRVSLTAFKPIAQQQSVLVILANNQQLMQFVQALAPTRFCEIFRDGHALLLSNHQQDCALYADETRQLSYIY